MSLHTVKNPVSGPALVPADWRDCCQSVLIFLYLKELKWTVQVFVFSYHPLERCQAEDYVHTACGGQKRATDPTEVVTDG